MARRILFAYAWDLADEGVDRALGAMQDLGADTVALAASYHAGKFIRPHGRTGRVFFPEDGTIYFRPETARYERVRPLVNSSVETHDFFGDWARVGRGLDLIAWTVCLHNTPLGMAHPDLCARNAFGDIYPYSLSPAAPAVRDYVLALCGDIARHEGVRALTLETPGWMPYPHGYHHEFALLALDRWTEALLALDFSDPAKAAARAAGIDIDRVQRFVQARVDRFLATDIAPGPKMAGEWLIADLVAEPELAAFIRQRCRLVADLVASVRAALPPAVELRVIPTVQRPTAGAWVEGSDLAMLAGAADALDLCGYQAGPAEILEDAWDSRARAGEQAPLNVILRPSHPDLHSEAELLATVAGLKRLGLRDLAFYNYGHVRRPNLDWLRSAFASLG